MADREIHVPFGPDLTDGAGIEPIEVEPTAAQSLNDPFAAPAPEVAQTSAPASAPMPASEPGTVSGQEPIVGRQADRRFAASTSARQTPTVEPMAVPVEPEDDPDEYHAGGLTEEEATAQGVDHFQMSILALKDSIDQGRELKAREKDRQELADALAADHEELADREDILANYHTLVGEQDAIIIESTQRRDAEKAELSQITMELDETEEALERMRDYHSAQLQPLETELGRVRATAEQAKNDERSRKSELSAAEKELSRADDNDANTMAIAKHQQTKAAYEDARRRSEQAKEQLAQAQRAYDDAKGEADNAEAPLERKVEDLKARSEALKESSTRLGETISAARKRRQYCDTVYQYPEETAKMRREVETAEATARQMDQENERLRKQLTESKKKARAAKAAIVFVIVVIIVFIVGFIVLSNR